MNGFKFLKEDHYRERVLDSAELSQLMESLEKSKYKSIRLIVLIALNTGMRRGEILGLKWEHLGDKEFYLLKTKTNKRRRIPIPEKLWHEIQELPRESEYLFPGSEIDKPIKDPKKIMKTLFLDAGIENFRFHDLRHTAATWMLKNGADLNVVRDILGHASIQTTQRYLNAMEESKRNAVEWFS